MSLIKIGPMFLNLEQATEIRDTGVDLEVFFRGNDRATTLRGGDAEKLRSWLAAHSEDLNGQATASY